MRTLSRSKPALRGLLLSFASALLVIAFPPPWGGTALAAPQTAGGHSPAKAHAIPTDFGKPHPEAAPELGQFAFLIGHWACEIDFLNPDLKTRSQSQGTWTAYYALDGHAIMDDFRGGFGEGYIATTFRAYNRQQKQWNGYWLDGRRGVWSQPLTGKVRGDEILLETQTQAQTADGKILDLDLQYNFYDIGKKRFRWRQHTSFDGGETWKKETMRIDCKRLAGP